MQKETQKDLFPFVVWPCCHLPETLRRQKYRWWHTAPHTKLFGWFAAYEISSGFSNVRCEKNSEKKSSAHSISMREHILKATLLVGAHYAVYDAPDNENITAGIHNGIVTLLTSSRSSRPQSSEPLSNDAIHTMCNNAICCKWTAKQFLVCGARGVHYKASFMAAASALWIYPSFFFFPSSDIQRVNLSASWLSKQ